MKPSKKAKASCVVCGRLCGDDGPRICDAHWKCPACGSDSIEVSNFEPGDDVVICYDCHEEWTEKGVERAILKKNKDAQRVPCPHCARTGFVQGKKGKGKKGKKNA